MNKQQIDFPFALLPSKIQDYVAFFREYTEAPDSFLAASGLQVASVLAGPRVRFCNHSLNNYYLIIGPTGFGKKTTALSFASSTLDEISRLARGIRAAKPRDEEQKEIQGPIRAIEKATNFSVEGLMGKKMGAGVSTALSLNEYRTLFTVNSRQGQQNTIPTLTDMYDGKPISRAVMSEGIEVSDYTLNLIAASTKSWLSDFMTQSNVGGGFVNRHLVFQGIPSRALPSPRTMNADSYKTPASIFLPLIDDKLTHWERDGRNVWEYEPIYLEWCPKAKLLWHAFYADRWAKFRRIEDEFITAIAGRESTHIQKLAGLRCFLDERSEVSLEDLAFGIELTFYSIQNLFALAGRSQGSAYERYSQGKKIAKIISQAGFIKKRDLAQRLGGKQDDINLTLDHLIVDGLLTQDNDGFYSLTPEALNIQQQDGSGLFVVSDTYRRALKLDVEEDTTDHLALEK